MDGRLFDQLARSVATSSSRRQFAKSALAAVAGTVIGASGRSAEAAVHPCVHVRKGVSKPVKDGTRCGKCGTCAAGHCVPDSHSCGPCELCDTGSMSCKAAPNLEGQSCGSCGTCTQGRCKSNGDACNACQRCRHAHDGSYNCESRCHGDQKCCPTGECVDPDKCCPGNVCPIPGTND